MAFDIHKPHCKFAPAKQLCVEASCILFANILSVHNRRNLSKKNPCISKRGLFWSYLTVCGVLLAYSFCFACVIWLQSFSICSGQAILIAVRCVNKSVLLGQNVFKFSGASGILKAKSLKKDKPGA